MFHQILRGFETDCRQSFLLETSTIYAQYECIHDFHMFTLNDNRCRLKRLNKKSFFYIAFNGDLLNEMQNRPHLTIRHLIKII